MNHLTETRIHELIASGASVSEIEAHFKDCPECFRLYMDILELSYDSARPLEAGANDRIAAAVQAGLAEDASVEESFVPTANRSRSSFSVWSAAARVLVGLGVGFAVSGLYEFTEQGAHQLTANIGQCEIVERRDDFAGPARTRELSSGPRSVCEIRVGRDYRLRLLEGALVLPDDPDTAAYTFKSGVLAVDRVSDRPLAIRMDELDVRFQGTRAVLNREQATIGVIHGSVEVSGPGLEETLRVSASEQLRGGEVVPLPAETGEAIERLFRELPAEATEAEFTEIIPEVFPDKGYVRQRLFLNDGRVLEGLVAQEGDTFTVITRSGTTRVKKSQVRRVQFVR
jgi:hypothetical protein